MVSLQHFTDLAVPETDPPLPPSSSASHLTSLLCLLLSPLPQLLLSPHLFPSPLSTLPYFPPMPILHLLLLLSPLLTLDFLFSGSRHIVMSVFFLYTASKVTLSRSRCMCLCSHVTWREYAYACPHIFLSACMCSPYIRVYVIILLFIVFLYK